VSNSHLSERAGTREGSGGLWGSGGAGQRKPSSSHPVYMEIGERTSSSWEGRVARGMSGDPGRASDSRVHTGMTGRTPRLGIPALFLLSDVSTRRPLRIAARS
jgi:hypothetical protein